MGLSRQIQEMQSLMDEETYNHCCNVKKSVLMAARKIEEGERFDQDVLENACAVLDIGKLLINEFVFHKAESLTSAERELMDLHLYLGYRILSDIAGVSSVVAEIVLYHHGRDRPCLARVPPMSLEIEKYVRVIHTADVYEALTEERGYRSSYSPREAYEMMAGKGEYHAEVLELLHGMKL